MGVDLPVASRQTLTLRFKKFGRMESVPGV